MFLILGSSTWDILLINGLRLNAIFLDLLTLGNASISHRHRGKRWSERSELVAFWDLNDPSILLVLILCDSAILTVDICTKCSNMMGILLFQRAFVFVLIINECVV